MIRPLRLLLIAALIAAPAAASAQSTLLQGGSWTSGHAPMYVGNGTSGQVIVQDSGPASGGGPGIGLSELNLTSRGTGTAPYAGQGTGPNGETFCMFDAPSTNSTGYHSLCLSPNVSSGGLISYQANGAASAYPLNFKVNGVSYEFPFTVSGIVGPGSSVVNDAVCWNNTSGTLVKDCGAFVTVGGNNTWTGTNNFTGTFQINTVTQTFPASGNLVGTSDAQTLTNKSMNASQINSGTLNGARMPALTGDVTSSAGSVATTIANNAVTNAKMATATQNTVKGAATSTAIADLAMPSCSAAGNALQWTTNTGFGCGTLTNQTAGWGLTGSSTFSISTAAPPYGFDMPVNMGMTASVGASALTINLTTQSGSTPSATNPVLIPFRSTTLATGTTVWTAITSALSIVVPSAATLGTSNNVPFRIWIFATYNAGVPQLGVALCSLSPTIYPCVAWETSRKTTVAIDGFSTAAGVLYATAAVSNDAVRIIGYADYSSGLATAGAYASVPTTLQVVGPGVKKPGDMVQIVRTASGTVSSGTTALPHDNTIPQITEGDQWFSQAITPTATPNLLMIKSAASYGNTTTNFGGMALFQDATANALAAAAAQFPGQGSTNIVLEYIMQAATTSATTFKIRGGANANTTYLNGDGSLAGQLYGGVMGSFLQIQEIMGFDTSEPANDNLHPGVFSATG